MLCRNGGGRHRGRFKWKKYSRYNGNLRVYWTAKDRTTERHRRDVLGQ